MPPLPKTIDRMVLHRSVERTVAFFKMSRSIFSRSTSLRKCRTSSCVTKTFSFPGHDSASRIQRLKDVWLTPSSLAI